MLQRVVFAFGAANPSAGESSRAIKFHTSSCSVGVGLSFLVADHVGWRAAFFVTSLGPLGMIITCLMLAPSKPAPAAGHCSTSGCRARGS